MFVKFTTSDGTVIIDSDCIICAAPFTQWGKNGSQITVMVGDHEKILWVEEPTEEIYDMLVSIKEDY